MTGIVFLSAAIISFTGLTAGSITDIKTREVPDMLNYGMIFLGLGISVLASLIYLDYSYLISSVLGFAFCFIFASIMFYTGQWGGGDAKMLIAIGTLSGLPFSELSSFVSSLLLFRTGYFTTDSFTGVPFLFLFLFLVFFMGGIYGSAWLFVLLVRHRKKFSSQYIILFTDKQHRLWLIAMHTVSLLLVICSFIIGYFFSYNIILLQLAIFLVGIMMPILYYSFSAIKILEQIAFVKHVPVAKVTEGDWIAEDIIVAGKLIARKKDLGISREQIQELTDLAAKKKVKTIPVKYGIPFVPSFLLAFIATNWILFW